MLVLSLSYTSWEVMNSAVPSLIGGEDNYLLMHIKHRKLDSIDDRNIKLFENLLEYNESKISKCLDPVYSPISR